MEVYNHRTRQHETIVPGEKGTLDVYVRGPTPCGAFHLGHALSAVLFDVIVRCLRDRFGDARVQHIVGVADIDERVLAAAEREGVPWRELAARQEEHFRSCREALNVAPADACPRASEHVPEILAWIERLVESGLAEPVEGEGVRGPVQDPGERNEYPGRDHEDHQEPPLTAHDDSPEGRYLWRFWDHPDAWDSPWGRGRPGRHAEVAALAGTHFGLPVDLLGGGQELVLSLPGDADARGGDDSAVPLARYRVHHGLLELEGRAVTRTEGKVPDLAEVVGRHGAGALRHWFLDRSYRDPLGYDEASLEASARDYARLLETRRCLDEVLALPPIPVGMRAQANEVGDLIHEARGKFSAAVDRDFDTTTALVAVHDLARSIHRALGWLTDEEGNRRAPDQNLQEAMRAAGNVMDRMMKILGFLRPEAGWLELPASRPPADEVEVLVDLLVDLWDEAREREDFDTGDRIRDTLGELGIELREGPDGTGWSRS